jgi:hypothetical protein
MSNTVILVETPDSDLILADSSSNDVLLLVDRGEKGDPGGVNSVFGRNGNVVAQAGDYAAFYTSKTDLDFQTRAKAGYLSPTQDPPTLTGENVTQIVWRSVRNGDASTRLLTMDFFYAGEDLSSIELTDHRRLTAGDADARIRKRYEPSGEIWYEVIV